MDSRWWLEYESNSNENRTEAQGSWFNVFKVIVTNSRRDILSVEHWCTGDRRVDGLMYSKSIKALSSHVVVM
ncbi:hypothetical protein TNCV_3560871 [Trichonephila clavipes]|nr:hypothetical protein TNCV_3560871 [Trichonephila clavipes]